MSRSARARRIGAAALHVAALTLVVAGIVHIAVVMLVPAQAKRDAFSRLNAFAPSWKFTRIAGPNTPVRLPALDPRFGVVACPFDLSRAPLSVRAEGEVPFWSVSVYDRRGRSVYSFNDRSFAGLATEGRLDIAVVTPVQRARLREAAPEAIDDAILVPVSAREGFVLMRAYAPDDTWWPAIDAFLKDAVCERLEMAESADG